MALDRSGARGTTDGLRRDRVRGVPLNGHSINGVPGRFMGFVTATPTTFEGYLPADFVINSVSGHFYVLINFVGTLLWIDGTNTAVIPEGNVTGLVADLGKKQNLTVCTSGTRPGAPAIGDEILETDTGNNLRWYGATPAWYPAVWDVAWGLVTPSSGSNPAVITANSVASAGTVTVTGLSVTFTAIANRRYEIVAFGRNVTQVGAGTTDAIIAKGVTSIADELIGQAAATFALGTLAIIDTPGAGAVTYNFRLGTSGTTAQLIAGATDPATIYVKDVGPSAAPA